MAGRRIGSIAKRWPLLAVLLIAAVAVACSGGEDGSPTPEPSATTTATAEATPTEVATSTPTVLPSPTSTSVLPVVLPPPLPSPTTQVQSIVPPNGCSGHSHVAIELLAAQPGMEEAVITEVNDSSIRVELFDTEIIIIGTGDSIHIHTDLSNDELDQISTAVDAVRYEC